VLMGAAAGAVFTRFLIRLGAQPLRDLVPSAIELEANLRFVQSGVLVAMVFVIFYYRIPLNRNVAGLLSGYALFIAVIVASLTLRSTLGVQFQSWWSTLQPMAYLSTVIIWCIGLWSRASVSTPSWELEQDYEFVSNQTATEVEHLLARMIHGVRS
jgi:hypothetical protein